MGSMNSSRTDCDVVVIGGGAAGMMAAAAAARRGLRVLVAEPQNILGKKLRITGKGRCNVTNNCDVREFLDNVPRNSRFLYSAINGFTPEDTISHFEALGVPLKTERGKRVFPVSDSARDIADALARAVARAGAEVRRTAVRRVLATEGGAVRAVTTAEGEISCGAVILATGGASYPGTGSRGDGYRIAAALGHKIEEPRPSLVPLESDADYCAEMQGFSLKNVMLTVNEDGRAIYSELGEMLFTHFGVSGPLVLSASAHMRKWGKSEYGFAIDLKPALDEKTLDARILRDFADMQNREFKNSLGGLAGRTMVPVLVRLSGIPPETKVNSITKEQRRALVRLFKSFPVPVTGPRPMEEAIVTSGGVDVREIDPKTMESKLVRGLYFAGEVIDVDAYTGGFNLQIAWSTGHAAGSNVRRGNT